MEYYFPHNQEFTLDYFTAKQITPTKRDEVRLIVEAWLEEKGYEQTELYTYTRETTLDRIDPNYDHGLFYYILLNSYIRDVAAVVWNIVNDREIAAGVSEKDRGKPVDKAMREFVEFAKKLFPKK